MNLDRVAAGLDDLLLQVLPRLTLGLKSLHQREVFRVQLDFKAVRSRDSTTSAFSLPDHHVETTHSISVFAFDLIEFGLAFGGVLDHLRLRESTTKQAVCGSLLC